MQVPMETEASSIEGRPPGNEGLQHNEADVSPKRARTASPPEDGQSASRHEAVPQGGCASESEPFMCDASVSAV